MNAWNWRHFACAKLCRFIIANLLQNGHLPCSALLYGKLFQTPNLSYLHANLYHLITDPGHKMFFFNFKKHIKLEYFILLCSMAAIFCRQQFKKNLIRFFQYLLYTILKSRSPYSWILSLICFLWISIPQSCYKLSVKGFWNYSRGRPGRELIDSGGSHNRWAKYTELRVTDSERSLAG